MIIGIDVAKWNTVTDYMAVKKAGVEFAIVKVINKSNANDSLLYTHIKGFKGAGIRCNMGYTYSYANTTAKAVESATEYCKYANEVDIDWMWLDLEDVCMRSLGKNIVNIIKEYKAIALINGLKFGIYTYHSFYNSYIKPYISELSEIPFWIARYPSNKDFSISDGIPATSNLPSGIDVSGWQYTSKGVIDGVKGHVDLDVWYSNNTVSGSVVETVTDHNPFNEPTTNCRIGTLDNDANWVLWYLWRFGKLIDNYGNPDSTQIDGHYTKGTAEKVKEVQQILGFTGKNVDGIVGSKTRAVFKKVVL